MFTMVFSEEDKQILISKGAIFVKEQNMNGKKVYLFKGSSNINFEENNIKYIKTDDLIF